MHQVRWTGVEGGVRWGYHTAATLKHWALESSGAGWSLEATVQAADTFRVSQRPLTFVVQRPRGIVWRWPVESLQIEGATLTARLGPQE